MRLLNTTNHQLHSFPPNAIPSYAILSHTWGSNEVTFADLQNDPSAYTGRPAWNKIILTCKQALEDGLQYAWIDTCCIDKSSSAELSEAINSMFAYYRDAVTCYAYLSDVVDVGGREQAVMEVVLGESRWFTRGWTLQELLAPKEVLFYSSNWAFIGSRTQLARRISAVTGIETSILRGQASFQSACVARRMFWVSHRQTTRPEDLAYCMLGIFEINMPTLYGEGDKAFLRLQEEILRTSDDHSLFAWVDTEASESATSGLLAASPAMFAHSSNVISFRDWTEPSLPFSMSNSGLSITLPVEQEVVETLAPVAAPSRPPSISRTLSRLSSSSILPKSLSTTPIAALPSPSSIYRAFLNCAWSNDRTGRMYVQLRLIGSITQQYSRTKLWMPLQSTSPPPKLTRHIFIRQSPTHPLPQDIIHPQPFLIDLQRGDHASDYALRAYLHDEAAVSAKNWFALLMKQNAFNESGEEHVFYFPGQPRQLALVLLMEYLPTFSKFFLMLGSGHNSHLPMMDYRVIRPSEHVLYNDLQHFLRASRIVPGMDELGLGGAVKLDKGFAAKRVRRVREWWDQFRFVYDPLNRDQSLEKDSGFERNGTRTCTKFSMSGVDHHVQIVRVEDGEVDGRGRILLGLRIGGHRYAESGKEDGGWDGCSQRVAGLAERMRSPVA